MCSWIMMEVKFQLFFGWRCPKTNPKKLLSKRHLLVQQWFITYLAIDSNLNKFKQIVEASVRHTGGTLAHKTIFVRSNLGTYCYDILVQSMIGIQLSRQGLWKL